MNSKPLRNRRVGLSFVAFHLVICGLSPRHLWSFTCSFVAFDQLIDGL